MEDQDEVVEDQLSAGEVARLNAFITALGHLTARLQTSFDPAKLLETLGAELQKLGLTCLVALRAPGREELAIRYISLESKALRVAEQLAGLSVRNFRISPERWPIYREVVEQKRPVFLTDAVALASAMLPGLPRAVLEGVVRLAGLSLDTRIIYLPLMVEEQVLGVLGLWGVDLRQSDIPAVSVFAGQVAASLEVARLHRRAEQLAVMEERERLAREIHDSLTQSLYSLSLLTEVGRRAIKAGEFVLLEEYLREIDETTRQALKEMRQLVYQLRPSILKIHGLTGALEQRLAAVERRAGVEAHLLVNGREEFGPPLDEELYRIAQEALNNALKHGGGRSVTVRLDTNDERVSLEVVDDGQGFVLAALPENEGMGLSSMRQRAAQLGGTLTISSTPGAGTRIAVVVTRKHIGRRRLVEGSP